MEKSDKNNGEKPAYKALVIEDTKYKTLFTAKFEKKVPWVQPDERKVFSFLPGTTLTINVKPGDKVKVGQPLLVFEAMKMMNTIKSNQSGTVKMVHVKPGDKFPKNQLLLEFE